MVRPQAGKDEVAGFFEAIGRTGSVTEFTKVRDEKVCYVRSSEDTAQVTAALTP